MQHYKDAYYEVVASKESCSRGPGIALAVHG